MEIVGLEPRRSDLARGIVIARSSQPLDGAAQRALVVALSAAGVAESDDDATDGAAPARVWHAAPWLPPAPDELDAQRAALAAVASRFDLEHVWCVKVETGIDGVAWLELVASEAKSERDDAAGAEVREEVDAIFEESEQILYAAPDAPTRPEAPEATEADTDEDTDDIATVVVESQWRNGAPPFEHAVPFPIERYPDIIDDYDWDSFGVAVKLAGERTPGEETVVNAFFALWLSVYQDERADEFEPFQRADVVHDGRHRSALMWVERFLVPAVASDQVNFLLWIVARLHDILPLAWARFDTLGDAMKVHAQGGEGEPFILAGNPFADRFRRQGEEAALAWAVGQSAWTKRELAGMLVEVALEHDPDDPATAIVAERLLRRAQVFDPGCEAAGYLAIVMIRQHRLAEAIALARSTSRRDVRLLVIGETAEHASGEVGATLDLLDDETTSETDAEDLAELVATVARHASAHLGSILARLPDVVALVPHLYNASFTVDRPQALAILRRVLALPEPARDAGEARTAVVMAWNNACIHAHALGDYKLAVDLADGGQSFASENAFIYHSAACAYAAVGQIDRALEQVARAIEHDYEHTEKMETDVDLSPLQSDPRFSALFVEWRTRRADLN
jgi:tetratricopeptide (TPR) repeat protein